MTERKAIFYGKVHLIPGIICDGYVLDDNTAVLSERGTADLLNIRHYTLQCMANKRLPKVLESFIDNDSSMANNMVQVEANNSPYKGRNIIVYDAKMIEMLISAYALALANRALKENQKHIGERCVILLKSLVKTALETAIKEACGFVPEVQKTAQKNFDDYAKILKDAGFIFSVEGKIATKQDIIRFTKANPHTLEYFLHKYGHEIKPINLNAKMIQSLGVKARRMNGYSVEDVAKITFWMDTEKSVELKKRMFGNIGGYAKPKIKDEIGWRNVLAKIFEGFDLRYNYPIGNYRADFFVPEFGLVLECNGDCHRSYDQYEEQKRDKFISEKYCLIRFHNRIEIEALFNAILKAKRGNVIKLYDTKKMVVE